jgi:hypothetical protein
MSWIIPTLFIGVLSHGLTHRCCMIYTIFLVFFHTLFLSFLIAGISKFWFWMGFFVIMVISIIQDSKGKTRSVLAWPLLMFQLNALVSLGMILWIFLFKEELLLQTPFLLSCLLVSMLPYAVLKEMLYGIQSLKRLTNRGFWLLLGIALWIIANFVADLCGVSYWIEYLLLTLLHVWIMALACIWIPLEQGFHFWFLGVFHITCALAILGHIFSPSLLMVACFWGTVALQLSFFSSFFKTSMRWIMEIFVKKDWNQNILSGERRSIEDWYEVARNASKQLWILDESLLLSGHHLEIGLIFEDILDTNQKNTLNIFVMGDLWPMFHEKILQEAALPTKNIMTSFSLKNNQKKWDLITVWNLPSSYTSCELFSSEMLLWHIIKDDDGVFCSSY